LKIRKKKIRMVVMLPEDNIRSRIRGHPVKTLSEPVQKFYNGPCAAVDVHNLENIEEIVELLKSLIEDKADN